MRIHDVLDTYRLLRAMRRFAAFLSREGLTKRRIIELLALGTVTGSQPRIVITPDEIRYVVSCLTAPDRDPIRSTLYVAYSEQPPTTIGGPESPLGNRTHGARMPRTLRRLISLFERRGDRHP